MSTNFKPTDGKGMTWKDGNGKEISEMGRGVSDDDITYMKLYDSEGTAVYVYPATGGTSLTVTTTQP